MDKREAIIKLLRYKELLKEHFDLDRLILFGSYANGHPHKDSDIDVAIVVSAAPGDYFVYAPLLWKLRREVDDRIEPILFEKGKDESGFLKEILRSGIEVNAGNEF